RAADVHRDWISDVVVFDALHRPSMAGLRVHLFASNRSMLQGTIELPRILRNIGIELMKESGLQSRPLEPANSLSPPRGCILTDHPYSSAMFVLLRAL